MYWKNETYFCFDSMGKFQVLHTILHSVDLIVFLLVVDFIYVTGSLRYFKEVVI